MTKNVSTGPGAAAGWGGKEGEMTQTLYGHMNKRNFKKGIKRPGKENF
jgi:hypothetical protein